MTHWHIVFEDQQTGVKKYRSYPKTAQWSTRERLCEFLNKRTFLLDYMPIKIVEA